MAQPSAKKSAAKKATPAKKASAAKAKPPASSGEWRREMLAKLRAIILSADPQIVEAVKWRKPTNPNGVPVWERDGIICTGETYKTYVKLTFMYGASLDDPSTLFNAGFGGGTRRAIDFQVGDKPNEKALKALVKAAVAFNVAKAK
jgi:hypothetical protein